jgi:hypothetical protein
MMAHRECAMRDGFSIAPSLAPDRKSERVGVCPELPATMGGAP